MTKEELEKHIKQTELRFFKFGRLLLTIFVPVLICLNFYTLIYVDKYDVIYTIINIIGLIINIYVLFKITKWWKR